MGVEADGASVDSDVVAKKNKNEERNERRERMERMRREAERAERRRSLIVVVVCVVIALIIGGLTGWKLYQDHQHDEALASIDVSDIGVSADAAGCGDIVTEPADESGVHEPEGTTIDYKDTPPAFGPHWGTQPDFSRKFQTADDRLPLERLVHYSEHGYTTLWYDQTIADDDDALQAVEDMADKFEAETDAISTQADYNENKFIAVPWNVDDEEDGDAFPDGAHVALTHWSVTGGDNGTGVWQYCDQPSGEVVQSFMSDYPASDAPEPTAA